MFLPNIQTHTGQLLLHGVNLECCIRLIDSTNVEHVDVTGAVVRNVHVELDLPS